MSRQQHIAQAILAAEAAFTRVERERAAHVATSTEDREPRRLDAALAAARAYWVELLLARDRLNEQYRTLGR